MWVEALAIGGLAAGAGGLYLLSRAQPTKTEQPKASIPSTKPACPPGYLPVLDAQALFQEVNAAPHLTRIEQSLGLAPENHAIDVDPLLSTIAEFVQLLPASESHHHAHPGGLLQHLLEVAAGALYRAEETKLPVGRPTEEQLLHAPRWRYAVLAAALLHDIGKPIADVEVTIAGADGTTCRWDGLGGRMSAFGACYRVAFPLHHDYGAHKRLPVILLTSFVPQCTLRWLSGDASLLPALIAYLSGESDGGAIGQLVKAADQKSVADNLLAGSRTRFATARQVPMIERLMEALRRMLADGGSLVLNREGAAGFCDGEDVWFVAGTIADKVRDYLNQAETRETGAAGIPTDNSRLFDVWLDYGAVRPNATAAIWRARVTLERPDAPHWSQAFTLLRFPLDVLYRSPADYPRPLPGRIEVISGETAQPSEPAQVAAPAPTPEPQPAPRIPQATAGADNDLAPMPVDFDAVPAAPASPVPPDAGEEFLDDGESASSVACPARGAISRHEPTTPVMPAAPRPPANSVVGALPSPHPDAEQFIAWIQHGIGSGELKFNWASAFVHFVEEGMLLITPRVFREYLDAQGIPRDGGGNQVKVLQRHLQKSGYARKAPNTYLHYYRIKNATDPTKDMLVGYLIPRPEQFFNPVPACNPLLEAARKA